MAGNPLGTARRGMGGALKKLEETEGWSKNAARMGDVLMAQLKGLNGPAILLSVKCPDGKGSLDGNSNLVPLTATTMEPLDRCTQGAMSLFG